MPAFGEIEKPVSINGKNYVEIYDYGAVHPVSHFVNAVKAHFGGRKDLVGLEIGVLRGHHAEIILREINPALLVLVDHWDQTPDSLEFHANNWAETWFRLQGKKNAVVVKATSELASKIIGIDFDFIYIDADHTKVEPDIRFWLSRTKPGGIFGGHDYNYDQIKKDVDAAFGDTAIIAPETSGTDWWVLNPNGKGRP